MNDRGWITGTGTFGGQQMAFLPTPVEVAVPVPASLALLGLAVTRRRLAAR